MLAHRSRWPSLRSYFLAGTAIPVLALLAHTGAQGQDDRPVAALPAAPSAELQTIDGPSVELPPVAPPRFHAPAPVDAPAKQLPDLKEAVPAPAAGEVIQLLTLHECRQIALEKQPIVLAAQNTLGAAEERQQAVCHLRGLVALLEHDLPIRRKQAALGVEIANAAVVQAEAETIYAVTRNYLSVLYARTQIALANDVVKDVDGRVKDLDEAAKVNEQIYARKTQRDRLLSYRYLALARRHEAEDGEKLALAALREAMGVAGDCHIQVVGADLPDLSLALSCKEVIALALARRGEIAQADLGAEVAAKEVDAQKTSHQPSKKTFASASDIHAKVIPASEWNEQYRPGALAPEMPPFLVGYRPYRVDQAKFLAARACNVADKTRGLVILEVENHYLRLEQSIGQLRDLRKAYDLAETDRDYLKKQFQDPANLKGDLDKLTDAAVYATSLRVSRNEAHYHYLLELAALERATAGGFDSGLDSCVAH